MVFGVEGKKYAIKFWKNMTQKAEMPDQGETR